MPTMQHERALRAAGHTQVAGVDEAGRGAWAGPVVAGAVVLPAGRSAAHALLAAGVNDSKTLSARRRDRLRDLIETRAAAWAVGTASVAEIDALGILPATRMAMQRAIAALAASPDALIIDAVRLDGLTLPQRVFNFADSISLSVAAASILAKTERDRLMQELDGLWPGYGFGAHKGYGTRAHHAALSERGPCPIHRHSFRPISALVSGAPREPG